MRFIQDNAAALSLIILPLLALVTGLFFFGQRVRYVDALLLLFYTQGQTNLLQLLNIPAVLAHQPYVVAAISIGLQIYLIWASARFGASPWWRRIGAAINAAIVYAILALV